MYVQLQQEKDPEYWGIDSGLIHAAMKEQGLAFIRSEVRLLRLLGRKN
jgi:hypothetical protein